MNWEQIKRLDIEKNEDMNILIDELGKKPNFVTGASKTLSYLLDGMFSYDEQLSFKGWVYFIYKINSFLYSTNKNLKSVYEFNSYIKMVKKVIVEFGKPMEFLKNNKKWIQKFLSPQNYAKAITFIFYNNLIAKEVDDSTLVLDISWYLEKHMDLKAKIAYQGYEEYINSLLDSFNFSNSLYGK